MTIKNIMLSFVVLVAVGYFFYWFIKRNQNAEIVDQQEVDDKTFTLDKMVKFVKTRLDEITKVNLYDIGL